MCALDRFFSLSGTWKKVRISHPSTHMDGGGKKKKLWGTQYTFYYRGVGGTYYMYTDRVLVLEEEEVVVV